MVQATSDWANIIISTAEGARVSVSRGRYRIFFFFFFFGGGGVRVTVTY